MEVRVARLQLIPSASAWVSALAFPLG
jgi:hypothetical protein